VRTPVGLEESVTTGSRFRIRALLPALWPDMRFTILALSRHNARLLAATRFTVRALEAPGMPQGVDGLPGIVETERHLQAHVASRRGESRAGGSVAFHGHGHPRDAEDDRLLEYFRAVDAAVTEVVRTDGGPLVLAAVEHFVPIYREVTSHPWIADEAVAGNPEELPDDELRRRAWTVVAPLADRQTDERLSRYAERAAKGEAVHGLTAVLRGAHAARVDTLFLSEDEAVWGRYDDQSGKTRVHPARRAGDEDLLDRAAVETLRSGGAIVGLARERMPSHEPVAALLRY
jgi:putative intracellular protease/amidase